MAQIQYKFNKNDEYYTPAYAVEPIIKYLTPNSTIWCPFDKADSQYVKVFQQNNFNVVYGHIESVSLLLCLSTFKEYSTIRNVLNYSGQTELRCCI